MKVSDLFESADYSSLQRFVIIAWGKLLYIDYESLPKGQDHSDDDRLWDYVDDYLRSNEKERDEQDEWVAEGMPVKGGVKLLNRTTVDAVFKSAQKPLAKDLKVYRHSDDSNLRPHSWISVTSLAKADNAYKFHGAVKHEYLLPKGTLVIDTHGLADPGELIISTDVLRKLK